MLGLLLCLLVGSASAAPPDAEWRTIRTDRFIVHYPVQAEAWSLAAVARLEAWRDRVAAAVGRDLDRPATVVITDPRAASNGMALPFLRRPRTEIWVTPPEADSVIGWNRRWDEGLLVHEDTHMVHMAMPARGGAGRTVDRLSGFGPVARKSPRWVAEGYATVVEGDETGFGRPYSAQLAAQLRRLATEGALPSYGELNGSERWGGMGFAYGVGSAYLRWLRDRTGPDSLRHLWLRMAAVKSRTFEEAFRGVFGDEPSVLYGRFVAEVTAEAMALQAGRPDEIGSRFIDLSGSTGAPDVSPDGTRLVFTRTNSGKRRAVVWSTEPDADARKDRDEAIAELLLRDPVDIPDRPPDEPVLEQLHTRSRLDRAPVLPKWIDDDRVLFTGRLFDRQGRVRTDLFVWTPETGAERRVTRWADVRDADPAPDGTWAVAVQLRWGASELVRVDLESGAVTTLAPAADGRVYDGPRISPDGTRVAWLLMDQGGWALELHDLATGQTRPLPTPAGAQLATPSWTADGTAVLVSLGGRAAMDIAAIPVDRSAPAWWTRSDGGALAPTAHDEVFYWLDEDASGLDVYSAPVPTDPPLVSPADDLPPLVTVPAAPDVPLPTLGAVTPGGYGLGPTSNRFLVSSAVSRDSSAVEVIDRLGDPIGRHEVLIAAGLTRQGGATGGGLHARLAVRSAPIDVLADAWAAREPGGAPTHVGVGLGIGDTHRWSWGRLTGTGGALLDARVSGARTTVLGHGRIFLTGAEPAHRLLGGQLVAQAVGGDFGGTTGVWARSAASIELFQRWIDVGGKVDLALGDAPQISLGGVRSGVVPTQLQAGRALVAALPPDLLVSDTLIMLRGRLGPRAGLFVERHSTADIGEGVTLIGVSGAAALERQPFFQIPAFYADGGIACRVVGLDGVPERPCRKLDHWTAWAGLSWRR